MIVLSLCHLITLIALYQIMPRGLEIGALFSCISRIRSMHVLVCDQLLVRAVFSQTCLFEARVRTRSHVLVNVPRRTGRYSDVVHHPRRTFALKRRLVFQMVLERLLSSLLIISLIEASIYLYHTEDGAAVEYYDCIYLRSLLYCRRPDGPIDLFRENDTWRCHHDGIRHSFESLSSSNISVTTILLQWRSTLEMAERYERSSVSSDNLSEQYLCQCTHNQSFGKFCEYLLPMGLTLEETIHGEMATRKKREELVHIHDDILCYKTLECDSGLLCLDWRDICDGVQQCMFGYDEDNCDKLELNECDENEYRCVNGMCIPDEYFLDGDYDCMDLSDEIEPFDDRWCMFEQVRLECDERLCPRNSWSCGDGQCIFDRLAFQKLTSPLPPCRNRRDQFFMCESHFQDRMWTLTTGKCHLETPFVQIKNESLLRSTDNCTFFIKCALSDSGIRHCPCQVLDFCYQNLTNPCRDAPVVYPNGAILAPYIRFVYPARLSRSNSVPDYFRINASIKCRGFLRHYQTMLPYSAEFDYRTLENKICSSATGASSTQDEGGYDRFCSKDSLTFNRQPYHFRDVCNISRECLSAYRISDGSSDCADQLDEESSPVNGSRSYFRFSCSREQPSSLPVSALGNLELNCKNKFDEFWMGTGISLAKLQCRQQSIGDCQFLRHYIQTASMFDHSADERVVSTLTIPFRSFCDTFWDYSSKADEDRELCARYWMCLPNQWRCRSGQCINVEWLLDRQWDCSDASDEHALFVFDHHLQPHNRLLNQPYELESIFDRLYDNIPLVSLCDSRKEFACYRLNSSVSFEQNESMHYCLPSEKLGDGHVDCLGGVDEQNTLNDCQSVTMLGENFRCLSSEVCIPYRSLCQKRCPNPIDDQWICSGRAHSPACSKTEFTCLNSRCLPGGRCQDDTQCSNEEDQYLCSDSSDSSKENPTKTYRRNKELSIRYEYQLFQLPRFPDHGNSTTRSNSTGQMSPKTRILSESILSPVLYQCNRGVGIHLPNGSIVCFCPQQYYGDRCQFHHDRLTLIVHLNVSQSVYASKSDTSILLKSVVLFLCEETILSSYEFHTRPVLEVNRYFKKTDHLVYPRSPEQLRQRKDRHLRRPSHVQYEHPYAIRIETYQLETNKPPQLVAVWQYPIYFDYLPSFRFAKVLHLRRPSTSFDPCQNKPCEPNRQCYPLQNNFSAYVCLCRENYGGRNCSEANERCSRGFCSPNALCKPNYRGVLQRPHLPYCICPRGAFGVRCHLQQDQCQSSPCLNGGQCFVSASPGKFYCICSVSHKGQRCEEEKDTIRLTINQSYPHHDGAVIQYLHIDYYHLQLVLYHQHPYERLPDHLFYRYTNRIVPEIVLVKLYSQSHMVIHLLSLQVNVTSINVTTYINESNACRDVSVFFSSQQGKTALSERVPRSNQFLLDISPIKYHRVCIDNPSLICFIDRYYLCVCDEQHRRAECFGYDQSLDRCSSCLAEGQCLHGDPSDPDDYICICPPCHSGQFCQFNSESFSFTLDQLFLADLLAFQTPLRSGTIAYLTIVPCIAFLVGLINNLCSFFTFLRPKCQRNGIGQYLLTMSIVNQVNLTLFMLRLLHLTLNFTHTYFSAPINAILCPLLNYLLVTSSRLTYWLVSLIAIERVYTTVSLKGQWLKKPSVARSLIFTLMIILSLTGAYELIFVKSYTAFDHGYWTTICILEFPSYPTRWTSIHQTVTIVHSVMPLLINLCSMVVIVYVVLKKKMRITERRSTCE